MFIERVVATLKRERVRFAVAGGFAVALHGAVRGTVDIDLVIALVKRDFVTVQKALEQIGLTSRLPLEGHEVFTFREEYIRNRNLIAWSFTNAADPSEIVDIILTEDLRKIKIETIVAGDLELPVVSAADLIRMKEKSGRPQDIEDIKALRKLGA